jgi:hypothetical protein
MVRRTATERGFVLSHLEFDLIWEDLDLGKPPYPLDVPSHGATMAERDDLADTVFAELAQHGLMVDDEIHPSLREPLELLARNTVSIDALVLGDEPMRLLAAADQEHAALAVLDSRELAIEPVRPDGLVGAVLVVLGDVPAGPGEPVSLPREAFATAMDAFARNGYPAFERALTEAGVTGRAMRPLATLVDAHRTAAGQLAVNAAGTRSPVLTWFDTSAGRYVATTDGAGDQRFTTIIPADHAWLARRVNAMIDETR